MTKEEARSREKVIKIIKPGTKKTTKCDYCGCEFTYEDEDIQHLERGRYNDLELMNGNRSGYKNFVICPQCKKEVITGQTRRME